MLLCAFQISSALPCFTIFSEGSKEERFLQPRSQDFFRFPRIKKREKGPGNEFEAFLTNNDFSNFFKRLKNAFKEYFQLFQETSVIAFVGEILI